MKVTPLDIRRKEFKRSLRGYSDEEVDVFLDEVADEFERLFQENLEMNDRVQRLEEQVAGHVQIKDALEKTLISAQLQADDMRANARKEAELILRDAELKARHIVNDSYGETQRVQQTLTQLKHLEEDFRFKFRSLLEGHLNLLHEVPISVASPPPGLPNGESASGSMEAGAVEAAAVEEALSEPAIPEMIAVREPAEMSYLTDPIDSVDDDIPTEETEAEAAEAEAARAATSAQPVLSPAPAGEEPTVESPVETSVESPVDSAEGASAETSSLAGEAGGELSEQEPPVQSFFFGRRLDDGDDAFLAPDAGKKGEGRDFEW